MAQDNDSNGASISGEVMPFDFHGAQVRVIKDVAGMIWFILTDILTILGLTNPTEAIRNLDPDEVNTFRISEGIQRGNPNHKVVSESGFYRLTLRSNKPEAREFQRWVTHEVLPQIRRTGGYIPTSGAETDADLMARALLVAQRTIGLRDAQIARQADTILTQAGQLEEAAPKVAFADAVATSKTSILVGEMAKLLRQNGYKTGQNRFFQTLRDDGILFKSGAQRNLPMQWVIERGYMEIKETTHTNPDGTSIVTRTPKVTGKGQQYFMNRYLHGIDTLDGLDDAQGGEGDE